MVACAFTDIQHSDVIVFKNLRFHPSTEEKSPMVRQTILEQLEEWHVIVSCDQLGETLRAAPTRLPSTRVQQNGVLKTLQSGEQFWKDAFSVTVSTGSVWTGEKREKKISAFKQKRIRVDEV